MTSAMNLEGHGPDSSLDPSIKEPWPKEIILVSSSSIKKIRVKNAPSEVPSYIK